MTILIEHPQHGRMHVYSEQELKAHEAIGWSVVKEPKPEPEPKPKRKAK